MPMPVVVGLRHSPAPWPTWPSGSRGRGFEDLEIYAPAAFPELDDAVDEKPSRVRLHPDRRPARRGHRLRHHDLDVQRLADHDRRQALRLDPAYTIIGFELTILFGGLRPSSGLLVVGRLPYGSFGKDDKAYDPRFSAEDFGLVVECRERDVAEVDALLRAHEAKEVNLVEA